MMDRVKRWIDDNGNECFQFAERETFERPWIIITLLIIFIFISGAEFFIYGSEFSLLPNSILFFFAFLWWMTIPMKWNENVIEKTLHEIMDETVNRDAEAQGTDVVRSFVYYDTKGTYAIITGRCFLVLLKSGAVLEYPIHHRKNESHEEYYECEKHYILSDNEEHIRAICPKRWNRFVTKFKLSTNTRLWLLILFIVIAGGLSFAFFLWLVFELKWWTLLLVGGYVSLCTIVGWVQKKWKSNIMRVINIIVTIPMGVVYFLMMIIHPFITIIGSYLFVILFAFCVPALIMNGLSNIGWLPLKTETIAFLVVAIGSILCSHSYKATKWMIHQTPLRDWGNHTYESYREALAVYLIHPSNIIFLLYLVYFVYLSVSGFLQIERGGYLINDGFDSAMLKAFLVFIAFTNMRAKSKVAEVDAKNLLQQTIKLFEHDK